MPIYFVSRALRGPEVNYTSMQKLVLALGQILADFIVECPKEDDPDTAMDVEEELPESWTLFTDGSSCADGSEAGLILTSPEGAEFTYALRIAEEMGVKNLQANVDSGLVANQVNGAYIAKEADMIRYLEKVRTKREVNKRVGSVGSSGRRGNTWMTPIYEYLTKETLPAEVNKARAVQRKSQRFAVINGVLYKKSFLGPWLRHEVHRPVPRNPQQKLNPITSPWLFYKWGIDIAGPFPEGLGKVKFLIVAIDYFINPFKVVSPPTFCFCKTSARKWVSRKSKPKLRGRDQGKARYKKQELDGRNLPSVIPAEIGMPILRTAEVDIVQNNEALGINLDLLEERRKQATIREAKSKAKMEKYYNSKVCSTSFKPGYLVYRSNNASRTKEVGKLGLKWEGPYEITEALGKGAFKLRYRDGKQLPRIWNVHNLKKCYVHEM
ncbi:reverse transcriptase domain-containing protein [Tanacetum coccineum]